MADTLDRDAPDKPDPRLELEQVLSRLATREDIRAEGERLRQYMTLFMERHGHKIQALIDLVVSAQSPRSDS